MRTTFIAVFGVMTAVLSAAPAAAQQDINARDGDRVIIDDDARVQIVRRRQAAVRTVFLEPQKTLIVLIDHAKGGELPDGRPDASMHYSELQGTWPLGARWEGFTTILEYSSAARFVSGFGLMSPLGLLQLLPSNGQEMRETSATVFTFRGFGGGGVSALNFDEAERQQLAQVNSAPSVAGGVSSERGMSISGSTGGVTTGGSAQWSAGAAAPGGANVTGPPRKVRDVPAVYPEAARQANVRGIVIMQITVGPDGSVTAARPLRSIPMLDAAAIEAVKQWQYEPTGRTTPVTLTVTVPVTP